jgi:hypothetical protein
LGTLREEPEADGSASGERIHKFDDDERYGMTERDADKDKPSSFKTVEGGAGTPAYSASFEVPSIISDTCAPDEKLEWIDRPRQGFVLTPALLLYLPLIGLPIGVTLGYVLILLGSMIPSEYILLIVIYALIAWPAIVIVPLIVTF